MWKFLLPSILLISQGTWAQSKIALVKFVRGEVSLISKGRRHPLKVDDWISRGDIIKTVERSFVKLVFIDKSQMNIGPNSEMKVEAFSGKNSGVLDLVKGKIRSQVTKDYLQMKDKTRSKLFIKTSNAVMGVRGTDFLISTNGVNTATILFEGEVLLNKLEQRVGADPIKLEEIVERGVRILPGEFSVVEAERPLPTIPAVLNIQQRERLERNTEMDSERGPGNTEEKTTKNVIPQGLSGRLVGNNPEILKKEIVELVKTSENFTKPVSSSSRAEGFVKGDQVKPADGSLVHVDSGLIIGPGKGAVLDPHTNTYLADKEVGNISISGNYIPPQDVEITPEGNVLTVIKTEKGETEVRQVNLPPPIISSSNPDQLKPTGLIINPKGDVNLNDFQQRPVSGGVLPNTPESFKANGISPTTIIIQER